MKNRRVLIILVLVLIVFAFLATKNIKQSVAERHQRTCIKNLADIEGAKDQYAIEHDGADAVMDDLIPGYLDVFPVCPSEGNYTLGDLQVLVSCNVEGHELGAGYRVLDTGN